MVGDLEELRPLRPAPDAEWHDPDKPRPRDVTLGRASTPSSRSPSRPPAGPTPTTRWPRGPPSCARHLRAMSTAVDTGQARAWAWVAHLRVGRYDAVARLVATDAAGARRAGSCPAPSSSSCSAGSTSRAARRRRWSSGCSPPARRAAAGPTSSWSASTRERRFGPPAVDPADAARRRAAAGRDRADRRGPRGRRRAASRARAEAAAAPDPLPAGRRPVAGRGVHAARWSPTAVRPAAAAGPCTCSAPTCPRCWPTPGPPAPSARGAPELAGLPGPGPRPAPAAAPGGPARRGRAVPRRGRTPAGSAWSSTSPRCPGWSAYAGWRRSPDVPAHATELARQVGSALSLHVLPDQQARAARPRCCGPGWPRVAGAAARGTARAPGLGRGRRLRAAPAAAPRSLPCGGRPGRAAAAAGRSRPTGSVLDLAIELLTGGGGR